MKTFNLRRVPPPKPVVHQVCVACKAFRAECVVPVGGASAPMCWICAHHVVEHDCPAGNTMNAECECTPDKIYPMRAEAAALWSDLYKAAGIDINPAPSTAKHRAIADINADIERLTTEIGSNTTLRARVCHCRVCGEPGHYAKTCPTLRRR